MESEEINKLSWSELILLKQELEREIYYRLAIQNISPNLPEEDPINANL